ncbi:MAG: 6-phosphogluconolactonase [Coxiellaceae bacterium]|nr:6-phosphogluconolactonase [Coxiellaceae bacterium]
MQPLSDTENKISQCATINIRNDIDSLGKAVSDHITNEIQQSRQNRYHLALSGGNTPKFVFKYLRDARQSCWEKVNFYLTDERHVNADHSQSNFGMIKRHLLDHITSPKSNYYPVPTANNSAEKAADLYAKTLQQNFNQSIPTFDLMLLGIGEDGHIASLFPSSKLLDQNNKPVAAGYISRMQAWRISLTFPVINQAKKIVIIASGQNKANIVRNALAAPTTNANISPIHRIRPKGEVIWFVDEAAASLLDT